MAQMDSGVEGGSTVRHCHFVRGYQESTQSLCARLRHGSGTLVLSAQLA